jgi:hypothetical protein
VCKKYTLLPSARTRQGSDATPRRSKILSTGRFRDEFEEFRSEMSKIDQLNCGSCARIYSCCNGVKPVAKAKTRFQPEHLLQPSAHGRQMRQRGVFRSASLFAIQTTPTRTWALILLPERAHNLMATCLLRQLVLRQHLDMLCRFAPIFGTRR